MKRLPLPPLPCSFLIVPRHGASPRLDTPQMRPSRNGEGPYTTTNTNSDHNNQQSSQTGANAPHASADDWISSHRVNDWQNRHLQRPSRLCKGASTTPIVLAATATRPARRVCLPTS